MTSRVLQWKNNIKEYSSWLYYFEVLVNNISRLNCMTMSSLIVEGKKLIESAIVSDDTDRMQTCWYP
jgi:hypothetical protein